jgi:hypothetical protein
MAWAWNSNRIPGYEKIAQRKGFQFFPEDNAKLVYKAHQSFKLFKQGSNKKIKYILQGYTSQKDPMQLFEYSYVVSTGKTTAVFTQHVISIIISGKRTIPSFFIRPQHPLHTIGKFFGMQDVEIANYDDFNKNYLVKSKEVAKLVKFLSNSLVGFLSFEKGWTMESDGNQLVLYKEHKRMNEEMIEPFLQVGETIYGLAMGHVTLDALPKPK